MVEQLQRPRTISMGTLGLKVAANPYIWIGSYFLSIFGSQRDTPEPCYGTVVAARSVYISRVDAFQESSNCFRLVLVFRVFGVNAIIGGVVRSGQSRGVCGRLLGRHTVDYES